MSDHKINTRPTSPHLQIYRWNISSITSIMHRLTGVALYFSILAIAWFIVYYTYNIGSISDEKTLHFRRGEMSILIWLKNLKGVSEQAYEELNEKNV